MPKKVDSDALALANKALGLFGVSALGETEFDDDRLVQSINMVDIIRRGRTLAGTTGIFGAVLQNAHGGVGSAISTETPYDVQSADPTSPWPNPMPDLFDIWLLSCGWARTAGVGNVDFALLALRLPGTTSWGTDDNGAAVSVVAEIPLANWDGLIFVENAWGRPPRGMALPMRLPRGCTLIFESTVAAAATVNCNMILGIFPISLGQDVVGG